MRIFVVVKEVRENGIIVKQKIRGITDSKKVTGFNSMDQIKRYIASCATYSIKAPFNFYKSYISEVRSIYNARCINNYFNDTGFTFKYKGISFFLYNHFEKNTAVRATHYITRIKEEQ